MRSEGSIGVWCKNNSDRSDKRFEAHFNYWHIIGDRSFSPANSAPKADFLEIGLLIEDPASLDEINVFIPLERSAFHIRDCSEYFLDPAIAEGIFNEALVPKASRAATPCIELRRASSGVPFACVLPVTISDVAGAEVQTSSEGGGTLLRLSKSSLERASGLLLANAAAYIRLRVHLPHDNPFLKKVGSAVDWFLRSSYEEFEYVDFRFNETRTLPDYIQKRMEGEWRRQASPLTLVAFLTAIPGRSQLSTLNAPSYKMRLLEMPTWATYVNGGIPPGMMVYHWKRARAAIPKKDWEVTEITDLTTFVRLENRHGSWRNVLLFVLIAVIIGVAGSIVTEWIPFAQPIRHMNCEMRKTPPPADRLSGKCVDAR